MTARVGSLAPGFSLPAFAPLTGAPQEQVALAQQRGRPVVLVFLRWLG